MPTNNSLLRYLVGGLIFGLVMAVTFKYVPDFEMSDDKIIKISLICGFGFAILNMLWDSFTSKPTYSMEGMAEIEMQPENLNGLMMPEAEEEVLMAEDGMDQEGLPEAGCPDCDPTGFMPKVYSQTRWEEDKGKTGLCYNNDNPERVLLQKGQFEKYMMPPFKKVRDIMNKQRYNYPQYHFHSPGYFLLNNGQFSPNGIPYDKAQDVICKSKLRDLYNQHNHNIRWSPHTHFGKSRGPMNWKDTYP